MNGRTNGWTVSQSIDAHGMCGQRGVLQCSNIHLIKGRENKPVILIKQTTKTKTRTASWRVYAVWPSPFICGMVGIMTKRIRVRLCATKECGPMSGSSAAAYVHVHMIISDIYIIFFCCHCVASSYRPHDMTLLISRRTLRSVTVISLHDSIYYCYYLR